MDDQIRQKQTGKRFFFAIFAGLIVTASFILGMFFGLWQSSRFTSQNFFDTLLNYQTLLPFSNKVDSALFNKVWQAINNKYVGRPVDEKTAYYGALQGLVHSLGDPYSIFLNPTETNNFNKQLSGSFEGIGAEIGIKNNQLTIIAPLPGSPAEAVGLQAGDIILKIDERETVEMNLDQAISLIRGEKGTMVTLTIIPVGGEQVKSVIIKRDMIKTKSVSWEMEEEGDIAVIKMAHFNNNTDEEFKKAVQEILIKAPNGIILDLRNNPGGYLDTAVNVAGAFLDKKTVVIEDFGQTKNEYKSKTDGQLKDIKTVVLVNNGSASASEIVAGSLQDYKKATIIGEKTFGKGSVQDFEEFNDGSSLKLTVAKWLTPLGRSIDDEGITPDVEVPLTDEDYNNNRDPQLDKALELLRQ